MAKSFPITNKGVVLAGGSFVMGVSGMLLADGFLIVLGICGFILLVIAWILGFCSLKKMEVDLHAPARVSAGSPFNLEVTLYNHRSWLDSFYTEIKLQLLGRDAKKDGGAFVQVVAPWVASGSAARIQMQVNLRSRGYGETHPVKLTSHFPLGLFRLHKYLEVRQEITVTPRCIVPVELNCDGSAHDSQPRNGSAAGNSFGEPRGIRPWQAGDSAKNIHWPASARALARGHSLRVREYDPPGFHPDHCHIVFHSYATGGEILRGDRFERALSLLAGSLTELQNNGIPCLLSADFHHWEPLQCFSRKQLTDCLCRLAVIARARGTEAHDLESVLRGVSSDHALMIISDMSPESWLRLLAKHPQTLIVDIRQVRYHNRVLHAAKA